MILPKFCYNCLCINEYTLISTSDRHFSCPHQVKRKGAGTDIIIDYVLPYNASLKDSEVYVHTIKCKYLNKYNLMLKMEQI